MQFTDLSLDNRLQRAIATLQLSEATEVQKQAIPRAMLGKDILVASKTGSGKTFAFLIPAFNRLLTQKALSKRDPRALILAPTRELAKQVFSVAKQLASSLNIKCTLVVGGENYNDQAKMLKKDPHIVVGTAGRIFDHLEAKHLFLNGLELLILDEADRMLELGFEEALKRIHQSADHRKRQTMMFSATADSAQVNSLTSLLLKSPDTIFIDKVATPHADIKQRFYLADGVEHKNILLNHLLNIEGREQALVFTATREDSERLAKHLQQQGIDAAFLHGDLLQNQRSAIINDFSRGKIAALVTTDLASRGLDIANVALVINYDLPKFADEYVHRIGRTGRAGSKGMALSLVGRKDWQSFLLIQTRLETRFEFAVLDGFEAKFKGMGSKPRNWQKKPSGSASTKLKKPTHKAIQKKRFDPLSSEETGFIPVKRKPLKENDTSNDNSSESDSN
uniref:DEAD/DEAH box helicase n=1 Tax=Ningiella ruwaisensis TaxID=2364274 RepID=UPI00109F801E|nr:DEAD/DEAH box helicase [Ningiella ruwaisensis]